MLFECCPDILYVGVYSFAQEVDNFKLTTARAQRDCVASYYLTPRTAGDKVLSIVPVSSAESYSILSLARIGHSLETSRFEGVKGEEEPAMTQNLCQLMAKEQRDTDAVTRNTIPTPRAVCPFISYLLSNQSCRTV